MGEGAEGECTDCPSQAAPLPYAQLPHGSAHEGRDPGRHAGDCPLPWRFYWLEGRGGFYRQPIEVHSRPRVGGRSAARFLQEPIEKRNDETLPEFEGSAEDGGC